jgi:hypothetical protein
MLHESEAPRPSAATLKAGLTTKERGFHMATDDVTIHPIPAQDSATTTPTIPLLCTYSYRPAIKRIVVDGKSYCGKLCAAIGLIVEVSDEDGIDPSFNFLENLVAECMQEGPRPIPVKVRHPQRTCEREAPAAPANLRKRKPG